MLLTNWSTLLSTLVWCSSFRFAFPSSKLLELFKPDVLASGVCILCNDTSTCAPPTSTEVLLIDPGLALDMVMYKSLNHKTPIGGQVCILLLGWFDRRMVRFKDKLGHSGQQISKKTI